MKKITLAVLLFVATLLTATAEIKLPPLIDNNMVLQRETTINVWGQAENNTKVDINCEWLDKKVRVQSDANGKWEAQVATPAAGGPYSISIKTKQDQVTLNNVLIGDVWFCSGQSNMGLKLKGGSNQPVEHSAEELINAHKQTNIRLFSTVQETSATHVEELNGKWLTCTAMTAGEMSAVAYFFARQINSTLDIPVGIINSSWGATSILAWTSEEAVDKAISAETKAEIIKKNDREQNLPGRLFNSMVEPATRYKIKGFLWYQGENNRYYPEEYIQLTDHMLRERRALWGDTNEDLKFYYAQLAPFRYGNDMATVLPLFVEGQTETQDIVPGCYMATTTDLGNATCIHPAKKKEVATRMAALALQYTYGMEGITCGNFPKYKSASFDKNTATVTMEGVEGIACGNIVGFEIAGEDQVFHPASARVISGKLNQVFVSSPEVKSPVAVRYAFHNVVECNLQSIYGVAAPPFRTDNWDK